MAEMYDLIESPELESPTLILGLDGWIDAGFAAANALGTILEDLDTMTVAVFDTDALLDHRSRRPVMHLLDGINTGLTWPSIELRAGADADGRDVLFLVGAEPDHRWRSFSEAVVNLAHHFGADTVLGLGAYPAPSPHTRPTRIVATATDPDMAHRIGSVGGRVDVPAGVHAAIERHSADEGIPATGLWAQVPHYAAGMPYPDGALALIEGLRTYRGLQFPLGSLVEDSRSTRARLDELVSNSEEHIAMVRQLEQQSDAMGNANNEPLPTGDDLAAELEQFLRDQE
ncbi:Proteasome assembly chaperone 2 [Acidimicrobiia bacterium]